MQIEFALVPLQQPAQLTPHAPPLPPPAPLQTESMHAAAPQLAQAIPPLPQLATFALLGLVTQLPSLAQQPAQVLAPHVMLGLPHEGATARRSPAVRPKRRGARS